VRGEFAENAIRKSFLPSEIDAIRRALEPIKKAAAKGKAKGDAVRQRWWKISTTGQRQGP
jgi:hypothetical protein